MPPKRYSESIFIIITNGKWGSRLILNLDSKNEWLYFIIWITYGEELFEGGKH
jgi:hypothetical protein